jgi:NADH-quinone oxidoreductase subunit L
MALALLASLVGYAFVADAWWRDRARDPPRRLGKTQVWFAQGLYGDRLATRTARTTARAGTLAATLLDERLVDDTAVEGSARATLAAARGTDASHRGGLVGYLRLSTAGTLLVAIVAIGVSLWA